MEKVKLRKNEIETEDFASYNILSTFYADKGERRAKEQPCGETGEHWPHAQPEETSSGVFMSIFSFINDDHNLKMTQDKMEELNTKT